MKREYGYGFGNIDFVIYSHAGLYHLHKDGKQIAKSDEIKPLKTYIDGFVDGYELRSVQK